MCVEDGADVFARCTNVHCRWYLVKRKVELLPVGKDLWAYPRVMCGCSHDVQIVPMF